MKTRMSSTLFQYIMKEFFKWLLIICSGLMALVFIFDFLELFRRATSNNASIGVVLHMVALKIPQTLINLFPFSIIIVTLILFWRLMRRHELMVMRMLGLSIWQILTPLICVVAFLKVLELFTLNPMIAALYSQFDRLENKWVYGREEKIALTSNGLWIRQTDPYGQFILRAATLEQQHLQKVSLFEFSKTGKFLGSMEAESADFKPLKLVLNQVTHYAPSQREKKYDTYTVLSGLTFDHIIERSHHPNTISFWKLSDHIHLLEHSQLSAHRYRLYWHATLANIILAISMVLVGAGCIFFHHERKKVLPMLILGVGSGFVIFFISDIARALGLSANIPIILAAWTPVFVSLLMGVSMILHAEDG